MRSPRSPFVLFVVGFILLGMPMAGLGVAWPTMATTFDRPIADLGLITLVHGVAYTGSTAVSGFVIARGGLGKVLAATFAAAGMAVFIIATTGSWTALLAALGLLGVASGQIDAGVNAFAALERGPREMGLLHAGFGVGSALAPLAVTAALASGVGWQPAFLALAGGQAVVAGYLVLKFLRLRVTDPGPEPADMARGRAPVLLASLAVFFTSDGMAGVLAVWSFTLLTEGRGLSTSVAGLAVSAYFGAFTASRLGLAAVGHRFDPDRLLLVAGITLVVSLALFWLDPTPVVGVAALIIGGFSHGPIFPLEVLLTAGRFGTNFTAKAIGFEIAGANVAHAVLPAVVGLLVSGVGLEAVAPTAFVLGLAAVVSMEVLRRLSVGTATAGR